MKTSSSIVVSTVCSRRFLLRMLPVAGLALWMTGERLRAAGGDAAGKQGVTGKVIKMKGNFMPTIVEPGEPAPNPNKGLTPLSVPVHVFKGKMEVIEKPDPKHPALVKVVQSGKDGAYQVELEPGEYTVVAEIDGKLYLNSFTGGAGGKMQWSTITVKAGEWAKHDIRDSSEAVF